MNKAIAGSLLSGLSLLMLMGYFNANVQGLSALIAFLLVVVLPGGSGAYLLYSHFQQRQQLGVRKQQLGLKTLESEILKMARRQGGHLTVLEVTAEFGIDKALAEQALDSLAQQQYADYQITDEGLLVYTFAEVQQLSQKHQARSIEDA